jgi:(4S)-4-hydroxy-5-phosphonooxypentane-2,3-dione isomerase
MLMSRIMVVVEFEVKPQHRNQFIELIKGHAQRSRAEDGCKQFDMLLPQEDPNRVFLVGAWRDQAALDAHSKGRMVAKTQDLDVILESLQDLGIIDEQGNPK